MLTNEKVEDVRQQLLQSLTELFRKPASQAHI